MATESSHVTEVQQTEHPYVVRIHDICGGRPAIKGSRLTVQCITALYKAGETVEEILQAYPHLQPASVYDAISYYLDHQQEIEQEIASDRFEMLAAKHDLTLDKRGGVRFSKAPE